MLRPRATVAPAAAEPAITVPQDSTSSKAPDVSFNPLVYLSNGHKVLMLLLMTFGGFAASLLYARSISDSDMFTAPLTSAQVSVFIAVFAGLFLGFVLAAFRVGAPMLSEDWITIWRKLIGDDARVGIWSFFELCCYMALFFVFDRTNLVPREKKHYDRDQFWFLWLVLCIVALCTLRKAKTSATSIDADKPLVDPHVKHLQRDQTEEWKGWMQIMFLWYHYFEAKELYNAIRLYIAAYVWMTGFGNFSYYYVKKDFSVERFLQMQWRLNFLAFWVCLVLNNEYMLYYICMLHTTFTVLIYIGLGAMHHVNQTFIGIVSKFGVLTLAAVVIWDIPGVFNVVWFPFTWLVGYNDPYKKNRPVLHEWQFRSHLDHLVWIFGMFCAYNHPRIDGWLSSVDALPRRLANGMKLVVAAACIVGWYFYITVVFNMDKKTYVFWHPYTSFIPIALYCVMRNLSNTLRQYHIHLFEWCGKITLETYIAQFHIWMGTTGINGSPKNLIRILPEGWPLCNFVVTSALLVFVSLRLFHVTNTLKGFVLPSKAGNSVLYRNVLWLACTCAAFMVIGSVLRAVTVQFAS